MSTPDVFGTLTQIWAEILGTEVDESTDFYLCGGHSLLATFMVARVGQALGVRVTLRELLDHAVFGEFATLVETRLAQPLPANHARSKR